MEVIYARGQATALEVHEHIPDAPSPTAIRTMLRILEGKGHLRHSKDGLRHVYRPVHPRSAAQRTASMHLLRTFFGGSRSAAIASLLDASDAPLTDDERAALIELIERGRRQGR